MECANEFWQLLTHSNQAVKGWGRLCIIISKIYGIASLEGAMEKRSKLLARHHTDYGLCCEYTTARMRTDVNALELRSGLEKGAKDEQGASDTSSMKVAR